MSGRLTLLVVVALFVGGALGEGAGLLLAIGAVVVVGLPVALQRSGRRVPARLLPRSIAPAVEGAVGWSGLSYAPSQVVRVPTYLRTVATLTRSETVRLVRHPATVLGFAIFVIFALGSADGAPRPDEVATLGTSRYNALTTNSTFLVGVFVMFATYALSGRVHRLRGEAVEPAAPATERQSTIALAAGVALLAVTTLAMVLGFYAVMTTWAYELPRSPGFVEFLPGPVTVLGGGWLGIMLGRWAPWRITPAATFFALIAWTGFTDYRDWPLGFYVEYVQYDKPGAVYNSWVHGATREWHVTFLFCMCFMALVGALLHQPDRRRSLLVVGAAVTLATVGAGVAGVLA